MTVKADSKGRLTGAQPDTRYTRNEHPDGRIEYVPETPTTFDDVIDVTEEEFESLFQVNPRYVAAKDIQVQRIDSMTEKYFPHALVLTRYKVVNEEGHREFKNGPAKLEDLSVRLTTLVRIVRSEK